MTTVPKSGFLILCPPAIARPFGRESRCQRFRNRIGPRAVDGSTTRPAWVTTILFCWTNRLAAARAGCISVCQRSPPTCRAASDGQIVAPDVRAASNVKIEVSRRASMSDGLCRRHASPQCRILSQFRVHFFRQVMARPQAAQIFESGGFTRHCSARARAAGSSFDIVQEVEPCDVRRSRASGFGSCRCVSVTRLR